MAARLASDQQFADEYFRTMYGDLEATHSPNFRKAVVKILDGDLLQLADTCFVSCWHARSHESAALWKLYSETQGGIAIKSTVRRLCDCFQYSDRTLILGAVRYCDFEKELTDMSNALHSVFMKRESYEHEHEVRLLDWYPGPETETRIGVTIECSPQTLIEEIVVSPYADDWMVATVSAVVQRLGFPTPVRKSRLMDTSL